jgi:hypothetical protein
MFVYVVEPEWIGWVAFTDIRWAALVQSGDGHDGVAGKTRYVANGAKFFLDTSSPR